MFSGIIEASGRIEDVIKEGKNVHLVISAPFVSELKVDQSIAHNGVCLTVIEIKDRTYRVTAVHETLQRSNLGSCVKGDRINLERCMRVGDRLDGHIVQGHVDETAVCDSIESQDGSWKLHFSYNRSSENITVPKGSICVNGVSLTVVDAEPTSFSVVVIPYTWEHTNLSSLGVDSVVNLEFDIIGKYISRLARFQ